MRQQLRSTPHWRLGDSNSPSEGTDLFFCLYLTVRCKRSAYLCIVRGLQDSKRHWTANQILDGAEPRYFVWTPVRLAPENIPCLGK
jgi:hypothetical protein